MRHRKHSDTMHKIVLLPVDHSAVNQTDSEQRAKEIERLRDYPEFEALVKGLDGETSDLVVLNCHAGYERAVPTQECQTLAIQLRSNLALCFKEVKPRENEHKYEEFFRRFTSQLSGIPPCAILKVEIMKIYFNDRKEGYGVRIHMAALGVSETEAYKVATQTYYSVGGVIRKLMKEGFLREAFSASFPRAGRM